MKRKHVRTRNSTIGFSQRSPKGAVLKPGVYRLFYEKDYYASFIVRKDRTVELYGFKLIVECEDLDGIIVERL